MEVDTKKIRRNLGSRDSIGLKRNDVLQLLDVYESLSAKTLDGDVPIMSYPSDFEAKH